MEQIASGPAPGPMAQNRIDPYSIVKQNLNSLRSYYQTQVDTLEPHKQNLEVYNRGIDELQRQYNQDKFKITSMKDQLDTIKRGVSAGQIDPTLGQEAMIRLVVPQETAEAMFPKVKTEPIRQGGLSPSMATSLSKSFEDRISAAVVNPPGWAWKKSGRKYVDPELLKEQYFIARAEFGYDSKPKADKVAFDIRWDATISTNPKALTIWKKVKEDPDIKTSRTYDARLLDIAARKVQGQSPFASAIQSQAPKQTNQRVRVISPQGVTGTIEAGELEQYLLQGFKRIQ